MLLFMNLAEIVRIPHRHFENTALTNSVDRLQNRRGINDKITCVPSSLFYPTIGFIVILYVHR